MPIKFFKYINPFTGIFGQRADKAVRGDIRDDSQQAYTFGKDNEASAAGEVLGGIQEAKNEKTVTYEFRGDSPDTLRMSSNKADVFPKKFVITRIKYILHEHFNPVGTSYYYFVLGKTQKEPPYTWQTVNFRIFNNTTTVPYILDVPMNYQINENEQLIPVIVNNNLRFLANERQDDKGLLKAIITYREL